ncbi:MAG: hypothetical protein ACFHWX_09005 [Bacteroidota bacterium]
MTTQLKEKLLTEAKSLVKTAKNELARPEEDVVTYIVCEKAYQSVKKFLMHYLEDNQIDLPGNHTIDELVKVCREFNPSFTTIDFEPMLEFRDKEDIWADMIVASLYVDIAEKTQQLVS